MMPYKFYLTLIFFLLLINANAQTISGNLSQISNQKIKLEGFDGLQSYLISETSADGNGNFKITYTKSDYGVGYLISEENKPLFVILNGEDIEITGESLGLTETIKIKKGQENIYFEQYAKEHPRREQALSAWVYLEKIYTLDSLFTIHQNPVSAIYSEKQRIKKEDVQFIASLPEDSYVRWFLPTRKLVSSVSTIAQYRPEEISETIKAFRELDYTDPRLYKSGLFKDAIENHFWLLENSGIPLDKVFEEMKISIDAMFVKLVANEKTFNEVSNYLFDLLERHSFFKASEYLALKILNEESCTINSGLANQLETYRAMKKGNVAPDIIFDKSLFVNKEKAVSKLSEIKSKYTLIVFGASWCPKCNQELPKIDDFYTKWKSKGVEVIFISVENDKKSFTDFSKNFLFPSYSDLQKWESKVLKDYYIFATPTLFLLDNKRKIILRPNSAKQIDAWVDWYLKVD